MGRNNTGDNTIYLLVGQRGAGKSHYAGRLIKNQPELSIVSRDAILIRLYGSTDTDPYSGAGHSVQKIMHRLLRRKLSTQTNLRLILDTFTSDSRERKLLINKMREYGATRIVALYFVTPLEIVDQWFWEKPGIAKMSEMSARRGEGLVFFSENAPGRDYKVFHELASQIDSDGFDEVIRIDPQKELVVLF